jgi:hypothetical protein
LAESMSKQTRGRLVRARHQSQRKEQRDEEAIHS